MTQHLVEGFTMLKMKIGLHSVRDDAQRIEHVRDTVGDDVTLLADANHAYNASSAIQMGTVLENLGFEMLEEPVPPEDRRGYAHVRSMLRIPIAGGEAEYTRFGFRDFISEGCVDIVQPDICVCGGISEVKQIFALSSSSNLRLIPHVWGSGIALSAGLQVCAALPPMPFTHVPVPLQNEPVIEFDRTRNPLRDDLLTEPFAFADGYVDVPQGPGLGVEVNEDALAHYRVL